MEHNVWVWGRLPQPKKTEIKEINKFQVDESFDKELKDRYFYGFGDADKLNLEKIGVLNDLLKEGVRVLDIGAGLGKTLFTLAGRGKGTYVGIEMVVSSVAIIERNIKKLNIKNMEIHKSSIEDVDFEEKSFDFIISHHVIEHLTNPLIMIEKMKKWIKPNGKIILSTPNADGLMPKLCGVENWRNAKFKHHLWLFGKKNLTKALGKNNLIVEKILTYGCFPSPRGFIKEVINRLVKVINLGDNMTLLVRRK